jgi:hypothetical protein
MVLTTTDKEALGHALAHLQGKVRLLAFTDGTASTDSCPSCADTIALAEAVAEASDRISLAVHDIDVEPEGAVPEGAFLQAVLGAVATGTPATAASRHGSRQ